MHDPAAHVRTRPEATFCLLDMHCSRNSKGLAGVTSYASGRIGTRSRRVSHTAASSLLRFTSVTGALRADRVNFNWLLP